MARDNDDDIMELANLFMEHDSQKKFLEYFIYDCQYLFEREEYEKKYNIYPELDLIRSLGNNASDELLATDYF